ncbi:MAG: 7-cyano-7-deazaguanine synthase [Elusimicrobia bacterium]|nr:7-cyano-7-deazaguanine synthase [Elusimicrobiota bacterium]MDE2236476.1 7-cyano-7-deazaguanine synthase [Elusimicrobiota bacterium]MDE2424987.1 7-cyano-7-deazaguanine synthase [Elusimicrobiota bacterium]
MEAAGVLLSGGVDSATLLLEELSRGREVHPFFVSCGFRWEAAEAYWIARLLRFLRRASLRPLTVLSVETPLLPRGHWAFSGRGVPPAKLDWKESLYLPGRNLLLLSAAAAVCAQRGVPTLALGILAGNPYPDASPDFLALLERALAAGLKRPVRLRAPYRRMTKAAVARRAGALGLPLELTFSCIDPRGRVPCGRCCKCEERGLIAARHGRLTPA